MDITSDENVLKVLYAFNPWWKMGEVPPDFTKPMRRIAFHEVLKIVHDRDLRRSVVLSGARRIGKTTILYQVMEHLLQSGVEPKRIIYVSFDHPILKLCGFDRCLDVYAANVYGGEDVCYFFDEVQYADNWDLWMKVIYDTQPRARTVATGSASPVINEGVKESGTGRWTVLSVPTLSFYEYCELVVNAEKLPRLEEGLRPSSLIKMSKQDQTAVFLKLSPLREHFLRYLLVGGFPELALSKNDFYAQRMLREDVVDKVLKRDIPSIYNVRSVNDLEKIFLYLCYHSGSVISVDGIAKELNGVSRPTVEKYIEYLECANLIYVSKQLEVGGKKSLKAQPKIYIADAAMRNAVIMQEDVLLNPDEMGLIAETAVYKHVRAFFCRNPLAKVGYHRVPKTRNDKEIDIVVSAPGEKVFVEVKYREGYSFTKRDAIVELCGDAAHSFIITKRSEDFGSTSERIYRVPAYAFLYLLGNCEKNGNLKI